jgi:uncharacterized protein with GYD domain
MPKYISLMNWTEVGVKAVKESPRRLDAARDLAGRNGCKIETFYLTFGPYDMVAVLDAPDDTAAAIFNLRLAALGNVRTTTLKAFGETEYRSLVSGV